MTIKAKEKKIEVGDKTLIVKEMVLSQRDFLFLKLQNYSISEMFFKGKSLVGNSDEKITTRNVVDALQEIIVKLGSKDLTELIINVLNTKENRQTVGIEAKDTEALQNNKMISWIKENMTWMQEPEVIKAILEVNNIGEILKNYMEIGGQLSGLFQSKKQSPESPQKLEQTQN